MPTNVSEERKVYHKMMERLVELSPGDGIVYDIGKSARFDYRPIFGDRYRSIDIDSKRKPDIILDVCNSGAVRNNWPELAAALLCNGVIEVCSDPIGLIRGCNYLLRGGGLALFGFICTGYPISDNDRLRMTRRGCQCALDEVGFDVIDERVVNRGAEVSYYYAIARRRL